jgi:hypothetical protein
MLQLFRIRIGIFNIHIDIKKSSTLLPHLLLWNYECH